MRDTLCAKEIEVMAEKVEAKGLHSGEDAIFSLGGMGLAAPIEIFVLGGAFGGSWEETLLKDDIDYHSI